MSISGHDQLHLAYGGVILLQYAIQGVSCPTLLPSFSELASAAVV